MYTILLVWVIPRTSVAFRGPDGAVSDLGLCCVAKICVGEMASVVSRGPVVSRSLRFFENQIKQKSLLAAELEN